MAANPLKVYSLEDFRSDRGRYFPYPDKCFESIDRQNDCPTRISFQKHDKPCGLRSVLQIGISEGRMSSFLFRKDPHNDPLG